MLSPTVRLYHKYTLIAFCGLNKKHLKTFHNINKRAGRLKSLPALFISMMHSNQNDHSHLFTGTSPGKRPNQTIIKLSIVSLIAMHKHVYSK